MAGPELQSLVETALPGASVRTQDLTGTQDHWDLRVAWEGFAGMPLLEQHRRVMEILKPHMEGAGTGAIHAVQIHTATEVEA